MNPEIMQFLTSTGMTLAIGNDAAQQCAAYCAAQGWQHPLIVADDNTWLAMGQAVEQALQAQSIQPRRVILQGSHGAVHADEHSLAQLLLALEPQMDGLIAVGSGTITDITRFVSHRALRPFVSIPTAASVDAYASITAAITIAGSKHSLMAQQPWAIFISPKVLAEAPPAMTAAGFGDMLAKITALADWQLAHILTGEALDTTLLQLAQHSLQNCIGHAEAIGARTEAGLRVLIEGLLVSGVCMAKANSSRPAAGAEHSLSHFWEMTHNWSPEPMPLHGLRTGAAAVNIAYFYQKLAALSLDALKMSLASAQLPEPQAEIDGIVQAYGAVAPEIIARPCSLLAMSAEQFDSLKAALIERYDEVHTLAASLPTAPEVSALLRKGGAPSAPREVGIPPHEIRTALRWGMYTRNRLTILEISILSGIQSTH